jgi:redox-sensing transcriptional repressor
MAIHTDSSDTNGENAAETRDSSTLETRSSFELAPSAQDFIESHDFGEGRTTLPAIPDIVIRRLPVYVRTLRALRDSGVVSVSSDELAERIGVTAAQIRRDLSYFGRFGKQGKGYDTAYLADSIARILGLDREWDVALAGLGNLGRAILHYRGFRSSSFNIVALFDRRVNPNEPTLNGIPIEPASRIAQTVHERGIKIGIIAVPADAAQGIADAMIAGGIRAILNYAPVVLKVPDSVTVREIDPVSALQSMTYYLVRNEPPPD